MPVLASHFPHNPVSFSSPVNLFFSNRQAIVRHSTHRRKPIYQLAWAVVIWTAIFSATNISHVQADEGTSETKVKLKSLGVSGLYRPGLWTEAVLTVEGGASGIQGKLQVSFPDGDGFPVFFSSEKYSHVDVKGGESVEIRLPVKVGRSDGDAVVRMVDDSGNELTSNESRISDISQAISPLQPIWLMIGEDVGLERHVSLLNRAFGDSEKIRLVKVESIESFPRSWKSGESIELVYLATSGQAVDQFPEQQVESLRTWVKFGGNLLLIAGEGSDPLIDEEGPLAELVPGKSVGSEKVYGSVALESFVDAKEDFLGVDDSFVASKIETDKTVDLIEAGIPLVVHSRLGFGQLTFCAVALDRPPFRDWGYREAMLGRLVDIAGGSGVASGSEQGGGRVLHMGYSDISGQLRASLDQFSRVGFVTFTMVAALTILYLICIGPGDWFLLRKVLGRMELTWITFPLITILFGAAAVMLFRQMKTDQIQVNQVEIIDVDSDSKLARGRIWSHIYSPVSETVDLRHLPPADSEQAGRIEMKDMSFSWSGFPSESMGGMLANTSTGRTSGSYILDEGKVAESWSTQIEHLPLQVSSTRALTATWRGGFRHDITSDLKSRGSDTSLEGTVTNPFGVQLSDVVILYGQWAYVYEGEIDRDEVISMTELRERSMTGFLTRSKLVDGRDQAQAWNTSGVNTTRIVEIMMFHGAAGGDEYTNLSQRFNVGTDMSDLLTPNTAILIGRTTDPTHRLSVDGVALEDEYDQTATFYRVVLPVEVRAR